MVTHKRTICICRICGKEFSIPTCWLKKGNGKFCSHECKCKSQSLKIKKICKFCGKEFETIPAYIKKTGANYCSLDCAYKGRVTHITKNCIVCGKPFIATQGDIKKGWGNCCSKKCAGITKRKENNPMWRGGISFEPYCEKFNKNFRERVRAFFGYRCVECGSPKNDLGLSVHHVNFNKKSCCDSSVIPLFVPLCRSCHAATNHHREYWERHFTDMINQYYGGKCYFTKEEFFQFNS